MDNYLNPMQSKLVWHPLTQDLKDKWVAALRSGYYKQGFRRLRTFEYRFCCLGVLCEIADNVQWDSECRYTCNGEVLGGFLSNKKNECYFINADKQATLSNMNDTGTPFPQIADWIEENIDVSSPNLLEPMGNVIYD